MIKSFILMLWRGLVCPAGRALYSIRPERAREKSDVVARQQHCSRAMGKTCLRLCSTSACLIIEVVKVRKKTTTRKQYNQVPHLTHNTVCESDRTHKNITQKRAKRSTFSQHVTTRLQGMTKTNTKHK